MHKDERLTPSMFGWMHHGLCKFGARPRLKKMRVRENSANSLMWWWSVGGTTEKEASSNQTQALESLKKLQDARTNASYPSGYLLPSPPHYHALSDICHIMAVSPLPIQ